MSDRASVLKALHARFDEISTSRAGVGGRRTAYVAIHYGLAANRRGAESAGWTACALARDGGMGRLRMFGVPPGESGRAEVPDHG